MSRKAVVFGTGGFAEVVDFYLTADSEYTVAAFTASRAALDGRDEFRGRPLIAFEDITTTFPPEDHQIFVAVGYAKLNSTRESLVLEAVEKGYRPLSYVCSKATSWGDTEIGDNVFVFENNTIQPFVSIGSGTILWSGNHLGHHARVGSYCFITSHVVISGYCQIGSHSFLGVNATISDSTNIGARNVIGPGTLIQKNTGDDEVYLSERTPKYPKSSGRFFR